MKVTIELDMTPEEAKELFVPSEKQAEFGTELYNKWLEAIQKSTMELTNPMNYVKGKSNDRQE